MAQIIIALLLLGHGVGHALFLANSWGYWKSDGSRSAFFENVLHAEQTLEGIAGILWLLPLIGFAASAWGCYSGAAWWSTVAISAALLSVLMIALWWSSLNPSSIVFALGVDVTVIVVLLAQQYAGVVNVP